MDETTTTTPAFEVTSRFFDRGQRGSKGRVFTDWKPEDVEPEPTGPLCADQACRNCNAHEAHGGTREVDHRVWKAHVRRVTRVWRDELVQILADHWGVDPAEVRVRFSVHAGCSCPCSPGWTVEVVTSYTDRDGKHQTAATGKTRAGQQFSLLKRQHYPVRVRTR